MLERVHANLDRAMETKVIHAKTRAEITDLTVFNADAVASQGDRDGFHVMTYATGRHARRHARRRRGDRAIPRYRAFVQRHLDFLGRTIPYFRAQAEKIGAPKSSYRRLFDTNSLDDSGSMTAALIKARRAGIGPNLMPDHPSTGPITSATRKSASPTAPSPATARSPSRSGLTMPTCASRRSRRWASSPATAPGSTRPPSRRSSSPRHLFNPTVGLYMHGKHMNQPLVAEFRWGRANGWVILAQCELLDVLPEDHPARPEILGHLSPPRAGAG